MKCKSCKAKVTKEDLFSTGVFYFCNIECAKNYGLANKDKGRKKIVKEVKKVNAKKKRDFYDNDLRHQLTLTQKSFNKLRKLQELKWFSDRGLEPECISCKGTKMDWCCGHLKTVGSHGELRFDEVNTYLQCNRYCNMGLSGNITGNKNTRGYLQGLVDRFGIDKKESIMEYLTSRPGKKWKCDELILMRKEFNKQIKELK